MDVSKLREHIAQHLEEWVAALPEPDCPILGAGDRTWSPRELVEEVRQGTPLGIRILDRWVELAVEREASGST